MILLIGRKKRVEANRDKDGITKYKQYLIGCGIWDEQKEDELLIKLKAMLDDATTYGDNAPFPKPEDILKHVYADDDEKEDANMPMMEYIDAIRLAMKEEMERDEDVFVLGEDVGLKAACSPRPKGLIEQFGEERVMDTPLGGVRHRWGSYRGGNVWHEANCGDAIFGLHVPCNESNHQRSGQNTLSFE